LLRGESGTGKELIAHAIHYNSLRASKPFIKISCAALPDTLIESELFGYEKGAFTGAQTRKKGRFELANGGTLFLDEIGDINLSTQIKLLRVLQEREFERLGASQPVKVDVRIIAATSANLEKMIDEGNFRRDLFYRLNVIPIQSPSLRQRRDDIPMLADHFIAKFCSDLSVARKRLSPAAVEQLQAYDWPGNVRELQNMVERAVVLSQRRDQLVPSDFACEGREYSVPITSEPTRNVAFPDKGLSFDSEVSNLERELILQSLQRTNGNKARAADLLGINRTTLNAKIKRLNLGNDEWVETGS
jgi:transcriptional regulator with PAS, ATPase and Fis domain